MENVVTLPFPISANDYWGTRVIYKWSPLKARKVAMPCVYKTTEATLYQNQVQTIYRAKGHTRIKGKIDIEWWCYPKRPLDWYKRKEHDPENWEMTVRQPDIDNINKVLIDALKNVAFDDDIWVRHLTCSMMEPDDKGPRIVVAMWPTEPKPRQELFT